MDLESQLRGARTLLTRALETNRGAELESFFLNRDEEESAHARLVVQGRRPLDLEVVPWGRGGRKPEEADRVWVLERSSTALREKLRRAGTSFIELKGEVHLAMPGLVVDRTNLGPAPAAPGSSSAGRNPFSDRASLVTRVLLGSSRDRRWKVSELADAAGVAEATASYVVRSLREWGFVDYSRPGRHASVRLADPLGLIAKWTSRYDWTMNGRLGVHAPIGSPDRFLGRLSKRLAGVRFAYALHAGASLVAPHAKWEKVHLYVDVGSQEALADLAARQEWQPGEDGRLVLMRPDYRESVWWGLQLSGDLPVVSTLQLALDLWHYPVRGREQAEHLVERLLAPAWEEGET